MTSRSQRCQEIALRQWINGALDRSIDKLPIGLDFFGGNSSNGNDARTLALSSDAFIFPALKVARCLADELCHLPQSALPPGSKWADNTTVRVASSSSTSEGDVSAVGGSFREASGAQRPRAYSAGLVGNADLNELTAPLGEDELLDALNIFSDDEEIDHGVIRRDLDDEKKIDERLKDAHIDPIPISRAEPLHLSVEGANLQVKLPSTTEMKNQNDGVDEKLEMQNIYFLGLLFYELFSGGERPQLGSRHVGSGKSSADLSGSLNILDLDELLSEDDDDNDRSNPKKKKTPQMLASVELISIESLRSRLKLPTKLCDLIANMLDCASGDLRGDESFSCMEDVRADLQSMMDKPDKFLRDIDVFQASTTSLPFNETTDFGRQAELTALQQCFQRSLLSGESEMGVIVGQSGVGKSVLAKRFGRFVESSGCIFVRGKFDQLMHQSSPFSALVAAFDGYCDIMVSMSRRDTTSSATAVHDYAQEVGSRLNAALGTELHHLEKMIPNLSLFLGIYGSNKTEHWGLNQDCMDAQKRLTHLLCQFVDIIATYSGAPIIIFLDDLQFADESSITTIRQLLMMPPSSNNDSGSKRRLFFLGCSREEGLSEDHPFGKMLTNIQSLGVSSTKVKLECMDATMINGVLSNLFSLPPRLTRPLADVLFPKTKGSPLFFYQLMISLEKEGALWFSLDRKRYVWDLDKILSREIPANVAAFFADTIEKLDTDVQSALTLLSCFGAQSPLSLIRTLESLLSLQLVSSLEVAVGEGLLNKVDGNFCFSHDRVQEASYNRRKPEERCIYHFNYGAALASHALQTKNDELLFTAVAQLNHGGPTAAAKDAAKRAMCAKLNLQVGKSVEQSDVKAAHIFYDHGISFLQKGHWEEHYDLSLKLFQAAAKCSLVIGDLASLNILSEQTLKYAKTLDDKLPTLFITTSALAHSNKLVECIDKALSVLTQLGEVIPEESGDESTIGILAEQTKLLLSGFTDQELLEHKAMEDSHKIMAMKFYSILEGAMQYAKSASQPIITLKMVQLSIAYGMSPHSPVGFAYFGMLVARLGDVREGYRFTKFARALLDKVGSERAGEVIYVDTQIRCFVEPIQATYHLHLEGYDMAMKAGHISSALTNMICYAVGSFEAGINLQLVKNNCDKARRVMEQHNHLIFLVALVAVQRSAMGMTGGDVDSKWDDTQNAYSSLLDYINYMFLHFTFRNYEQMKINTEKFFECSHVTSWSLLYSHSSHAHISGLASFWIYRQSKDPIWLERGIEAKEKFKKWYSDTSNSHFESRLYLLEAEESYAKKDIENAKLFYEKAISSAKKNHLVNYEAYGCELAGYFLLENGDTVSCWERFANAKQKFHEWGATKKAEALDAFILNKTA